MKTRYARFAFFCFFAISTNGAFGQGTIFSSFGPNDGYDAYSGRGATWSVDAFGSSANFGGSSAASFVVPNNNYSLSLVTLAVGYIQDTNNLAISLVADNGGSPTGALIEDLIIHPDNILGLQQVVIYNSSLNPVLVAGSRYWLVVSPYDLNIFDRANNSAYAWHSGTITGLNALRTYNFATDAWDSWQQVPNSVMTAFRIEGTLVPEPDGLWLLLGGLGWLAVRRRSASVPV